MTYLECRKTMLTLSIPCKGLFDCNNMVKHLHIFLFIYNRWIFSENLHLENNNLSTLYCIKNEKNRIWDSVFQTFIVTNGAATNILYVNHPYMARFFIVNMISSLLSEYDSILSNELTHDTLNRIPTSLFLRMQK